MDNKDKKDKWLVDSPIEETLKLLIENLSMLNKAISKDNTENRENIQEIVKRLEVIPLESIIETLKNIEGNSTLWNSISSRLIQSKSVDINENDVDYVISELLINAYQELEHKRKYAVMYEWGKRLFWTLISGALVWTITLLLNIVAKVNG